MSSQDSLDDEMNMRLACAASEWTDDNDRIFAGKLEARRCLLQGEQERQRRSSASKPLPATPEKRKTSTRDDTEQAGTPNERKARSCDREGEVGAAPSEVLPLPVTIDVDDLVFIEVEGFAYEVKPATGKEQKGKSERTSAPGGGESVETMRKEIDVACVGMHQETVADLVARLDEIQLRAAHAVIVRGVRVAVISGPAGSGKSALLKVLALWNPSAKVVAPTQGARRVCQSNIDEVLKRKSFKPELEANTTCAYG